MLDYTATYRSTDNNPCDNILEGLSSFANAALYVSDYMNSIFDKENNDAYCMIKPENLTIATPTISEDLLGALSETTASILGSQSIFDRAMTLGELLAASGSNAG